MTEQTFNGVNVKIDLDNNTITVDDQVVLVMKSYSDYMPQKKFTIKVGRYEIRPDGSPIGGTDRYNREKSYNGGLYDFFSQDWITQRFRKMAMANNIGENELADYLGEKTNFFLNQFATDGVTQAWIECTPPFLEYSAGKFTVANNSNSTDELKLFVDEQEFLMNLVDGIYEYEPVLDTGKYNCYVKNLTVGNKSFAKEVTVQAQV